MRFVSTLTVSGRYCLHARNSSSYSGVGNVSVRTDEAPRRSTRYKGLTFSSPVTSSPSRSSYRRNRAASQQAAQQAEAQGAQAQQATQQQMDNFKKAFSVCLEGKGYTVKY